MPRNTNKQDPDEDDQIYSNLGLQVKSTFTPDDFLSNPDTFIMLERDFCERMTSRIEGEVADFYEELRKHEHDVASGMLAHDKGGEGIAILMSILANNIKKDYRFEMFYEHPELATPLLKEYEIAN
jgi:hypothetical protein